MEPEYRVDPMSRVFPRMTKCIFYKYGGSGTIQRIDSLCVLSMNILNEKIYIFLWFWFILLALITGVNLLFRSVTFFYPNFRERYLKNSEILLFWSFSRANYGPISARFFCFVFEYNWVFNGLIELMKYFSLKKGWSPWKTLGMWTITERFAKLTSRQLYPGLVTLTG